jgi:transaldolase/glucose-6-phosphate isomerase
MNALLALKDYGQSYWLDNLTRAMITSGELARRVTQQGLRGVTSNPSIFDKAISHSSDYDVQIRQLVEERRSLQEIYEALVVKDVQDACDILRPVYDESHGIDGFVSLEVSPYLAHDAQGTTIEARRLFAAVSRPNCLIKIPGTQACVPAIERMLYEGVNINITLLFSIEAYGAVARAYVSALELRAAENKPVAGIASVASFFLSRIDVLTDQLLGQRIVPGKTDGQVPGPESLLGEAAVANAKLAYQRFKAIFSGDRWQALASKGARVQRPLWASTSTKDPLYQDVRYVEPLIGPDTVNTMPEETIRAFSDHGRIEDHSVEKSLDRAQKVVSDLKAAGVDLDFVTRQLVNEGIQKFIDPYNELMRSLAAKREKLLELTNRQTVVPAASRGELSNTLVSLDQKQFSRRLFSKDPLLWSRDSSARSAIQARLGWLDSIEKFQEKAGEIADFAEEAKREGFTHVVLLGMGGSSLCPEVARKTYGVAPGCPDLIVLDNTDPAAVAEVESSIDMTRTLFLVASKSGTTTETIDFYRYFHARVREKRGDGAGRQFVAITDPGTPLVKEAQDRGFRRVFENPCDLGGRYSALSYFGLVPMGLIGVDIRRMLELARQLAIGCGPAVTAQSNPAVTLGSMLAVNQHQGRDKVTFVLSSAIHAFGVWVEQLIAESTGKMGKGLVPIEGEPLGTPDVYGADRVFVHLSSADGEGLRNERRVSALERAGHPVIRVELRDKLGLGAEFFRWEFATATAGAVMGVNPFDEPNVAESKRNTRDLLDEWQQRGSFSEGEPLMKDGELALYCRPALCAGFDGKRGSIREFLQAYLENAGPGQYVAILSYFLRTEPRHRALQAIRQAIRDRRRVATTLGYGPRYLHSTGQLHKGGANNGLLILLTANSRKDLPIPGEKYGFAALQRAQALGDWRSLNDKERRVVRIHLGKRVESGLRTIRDLLK